jgi:hypothetical protein
MRQQLMYGNPSITEEMRLTREQRRRTQIRLAQRAYRQRKETTIANLKGQVSNLQATIEEMENIFLAYNDKAVASGLLQKNPDLAKDLKAATEAFIQLAKKTHSSDSEDHSDSEPEEIPRRPISSYQEDIAAILGGSTNNPLSLSPEPRDASRNTEYIGLGYTQVFDDTLSHPPSGSNSNSLGSPIHPTAKSGMDGAMNMNFLDSPFTTTAANANTNPLAVAPTASSMQGINRPVIDLSAGDRADMLTVRSLSAPYTYSFEETTFARRLQRAALERGFYLISNAELRPAAFLRVFRLSLLYHTRDTLLMKFRRGLAKTTEEPLETYQTPFIHLGGAGMHYNAGRIRNGYIVKPGPLQRQAILESTESPGAVVDIELDLSEYEGEWFDSNDVEGYLNEMGLQINPQSTFVEGRIVLPSTTANLLAGSPPANIFDSPQPSNTDIDLTSMTTATTATPPTPMLSDTALELGTQRLFPELGAASPNTLWSTTATDWLMGSGDKTPDFLSSGWANINQPSGWDMGDAVGFNNFDASNLAQPPAPAVEEKKQVTVDVSKLIDGRSSNLLFSMLEHMADKIHRTDQERNMSWSCSWL